MLTEEKKQLVEDSLNELEQKIALIDQKKNEIANGIRDLRRLKDDDELNLTEAQVDGKLLSLTNEAKELDALVAQVVEEPKE